MTTDTIYPADDRAAWTAADMAGNQSTIVRFRDAEIEEMRAVVDMANTNGITARDAPDALFRWPAVAARMEAAYPELQHGRGYIVLGQIPVDQFSKEEAALVYWGLGLSIGKSVSQSAKGDRIGHVRDMSDSDPNVRAYQNKNMLNPHTDHTEVVCLLCLRDAKSGGATPVASALAIHNEILSTRPDLIEILYRGFRYHRRGEEQPGDDPMTPHRVPVFSRVGDHVSCRLIRPYIEAAADELGTALTGAQLEALDLVQHLADDPKFCQDLRLEAGTMIAFNNYTILHSRRPFEDHELVEDKRHLLRMWLVPDEFRPVVPEVELYSTKGGIAASDVTSNATFDWGVGGR